MSSRLVAALAVAAGSLLPACADDGPTVAVTRGSADPVDPTGEVAEVQALDNTFEPQQLTVAPGTEVRWVNVGENDHDVVPVADEDWGVATEAFAPGASHGEVFASPGEYPYYCTLHGTPTAGMIGVVVVEE